MPRSLIHLRGLPYPAQITAIEREIDMGGIEALVKELASFRDYQPLAHALSVMATRDMLAEHSTALIPLLLDLADTGLRRVLLALDEVMVPKHFIDTLAKAAWSLPIERVAAVAMINRWLKNQDPDIGRRDASRAMQHCRVSLRAANLEDIGDDELMRLRGSCSAELADIASSAGIAEPWRHRQERFAARVLDVLEGQPKSLSQANAEELLSRQVYTDPGHFLIELLQNADDAGARSWRVRVFEDRIEVEHDGTPFDALDVVGILSIGQTTKGKDQIGFFGVGFKSVYEICERPQLYSGAFHFEIADVSIPRPLRPLTDLVPGHTRLILPLRKTHNAAFDPALFFDKLEGLSAEVVLTLNAVRELDFRHGQMSRLVRARDLGGGRVRIEDGAHSRMYLVEREEALYAGTRATHRAQRTPILLALALDDGGRPMPLGKGPTIYSYLPTHERSGLRVLVHAHFDLPVDRERLDLNSPWNRWALARAGGLLRLAIKRLNEGSEQGATEADAIVDAALQIISLPAELSHRAFESLAEALRGAMFLPGADGHRLSGEMALVSDDPRLIRALAGVEMQGERRLLRSLDRREAQVARLLGAIDLDICAVLDLLILDARSRDAGAPFDAPWIREMPALTAALSDPRIDLHMLQEEACLPDSHGCARAATAVFRAQGLLRDYLTNLRPLVDERLEHASSSGFLDKLGVVSAQIRDLVEICADPMAAQRLVSRVGAAALLAFFHEAPPAELRNIAKACIVPDQSGALATIAEIWIAGDSELASLVRSAATRPALVETNLEASSRTLLRQLGCRELTLATILDLLDEGHLVFSEAQLPRLHACIEDQAQQMDPRLAHRVARARIFPCRGGGTMALVGEPAASVPYDEELTQVWPDRAWLVADIARLSYVRALGVAILGPSDLAIRLVEDPGESSRRRRMFAYLSARPGTLGASLAESLARAKVWPDVHDNLRSLDDLRRPSVHDSVTALYAIWPQAMTVEDNQQPGNAIELAEALGLSHRIVTPDLATALTDLCTQSAVASGPFRSGSELDLDNPATEQIVRTLLIEAAGVLPRATLSAICQAPIFKCRDGIRRRLGTWPSASRHRAMRVTDALSSAFEALGYPLLEASEATGLEPLLAALGVHAATLSDLVRCSGAETASVGADSAFRIRQALCADLSGLALVGDQLRAALSLLLIWPTRDGLVPASQALTSQSLDALLIGTDVDWQAAWQGRSVPMLAPEAESDASVLAAYFDFADPGLHVATLLQELALLDAPLSEQSELLNGLDKVARLAAALATRLASPWELPISVDARGHLVARRLLLATSDVLTFCHGLPIFEQLAHPSWQEIVLRLSKSDLVTVSCRQVLAAMRETSGEERAPAEHASLRSAESRAAFYRWILEHRDDISNDQECLGTLGKSAVIISEAGVLRTPRELLFDSELPALGIDWNAAAEVPAPLCEWLRGNYRPASKQLRPLVDHMIHAIDEAAAAGAGDQLAQILEHMARILRAEQAGGEHEELVRRFKLRKRLRVESADARFEFARRLLATEPVDADLVPRFAQAPPPSISRRYQQPAILRLLRAAGAEDELGDKALQSLLDGEGQRAGSDALVALACYLGGATQRQPSLRHDLNLHRYWWLPDKLGQGRRAVDLYWPTPDIEALIGRDPHLYVHAEFVHRLPEANEHLALRDVQDARLQDVTTFLCAQAALGIAASDEALLWLDAGLAAKRLDKREVARLLIDVPMLVDDLGQMRRAPELLISGARRLFGERRANWSRGTEYRHLAVALGISKRPTKSDVLFFLEQIHREYLTYPDRLSSEQELHDRLPRCLDLLVEEGGKGPAHLPVAALSGGKLVIAILPLPGKTIALPDEAEPADLVLLAPDGAETFAWRRYLRAYGLRGEAHEPSSDAREQSAPMPPRTRDREPRSASAKESRLQKSHAPEAIAEPPDDEDTGMLARMRRWFRADKGESRHEHEQASSPAPSTQRGRSTGSDAQRPSRTPSDSQAIGTVDQAAWFRGDRSLATQLASNPAWLADRTRVADFGLAHAPETLPLPHRYAPLAIFADFDRRRQRWSPLVADPIWRKGGATKGRLHLRGRLPSPEAAIPLPLYGHLSDYTSDTEIQFVTGQTTTLLLSKGNPVLSLVIELQSAPNFGNARPAKAPKHMLTSCVADRELPDEVHEVVASLAREESALHIASTLCAFIKKRYVYDPSYLEDPLVAAWLRERSAGRSNTHIAALHAGSDARHLGRGVCYELNVLLCELLRRSGVPAAVATGWTFDRGHIDEPDHLWAMALMQTQEGPRWLPVDASTTNRGRPLHAARRPPGPWRADKHKAKNIKAPEWELETLELKPVDALPVGDLLRVARYLEQHTGRHLGTRSEILAACRALLSDPTRASLLADFLGEAPHDPDEPGA